MPVVGGLIASALMSGPAVRRTYSLTSSRPMTLTVTFGVVVSASTWLTDTVGASGAISGVMGAYLVLFPNVKIRSLIIFFIILFRDIEAKWLLGIWFVTQFFTSPNAGVAWVAHVGGFAFGALVALFLRDRLRPSRVSRFEPEPDPTW